ncbi:MAG: RluA family pseudouridine synthase [Holosporales bacterium]|jgi:23S rRNA pseudouridine955/2504/2580 synthase|nr:RluA family pseudouridine synthase [Holosporales bacterium]
MDFTKTRLDKVIRNRFGKSIPQSMIERALRNKDILVNGAKAKASDKVPEDIELCVHSAILKSFKDYADAPHGECSDHLIERFRKMIVYEDDDLIIIDKPSGLAVQKGSKTEMTVDVMARGYTNNARLVHRIDKDTSGITILAKNASTARYMLFLFQNKRVEKRYKAIITGQLPSKSGVINSPLLRIPERTIIDHMKGKSAITRYEILRTDGEHTTISAIPVTGRTHQIRVHLASLKCPILGDNKYGGQKYEHLCLHAEYVCFKKNDDRLIKIKLPAPTYFKENIIC